MNCLDNISTYLILSDTTDYLTTGTISHFYEIEQFIPPKLNLYNQHTYSSSNRTFAIDVKNPFELNQLINKLMGDKYKKYNTITIVKFWGRVSQTFSFIGSFPSSANGYNIEFTFDQGSFSEKNDDMSKYWVRILLPYLRNKKLDQLLNI